MQRRDCPGDIVRYRHGAAGFSLDVNMDQKSLRAGQIIIIAKQTDLVANAAVSTMADPHSDIDDRWKGNLLEIPAIRLCDQADDRTRLDVENVVFDQILAHGGIEKGEICHVRHVTIGVVVSPSRRHRAEVDVGGSWFRSRSTIHGRTPSTFGIGSP